VSSTPTDRLSAGRGRLIDDRRPLSGGFVRAVRPVQGRHVQSGRRNGEKPTAPPPSSTRNCETAAHLQAILSAPERIRTSDLRFRRPAFRVAFACFPGVSPAAGYARLRPDLLSSGHIRGHRFPGSAHPIVVAPPSSGRGGRLPAAIAAVSTAARGGKTSPASTRHNILDASAATPALVPELWRPSANILHTCASRTTRTYPSQAT